MLQITQAQTVVREALVRRRPLMDAAATRTLEAMLHRQLPVHTLMQRAGLAVARLALAIAPHANRVWIACGPGNNGGDGVEAAMWLKRWGKDPVVTLVGDPARLPADAAASWQRARDAGVAFADAPAPLAASDLVIDALLGIGAQRPPHGLMREWLNTIAHTPAQVLCVDVPTGLNADTGEPLDIDGAWWRTQPAERRHTLSLLSLKPGLFTAHGRDAAGAIWFDALQEPDDACVQGGTDAWPTAWLNSGPIAMHRRHASHKGSHGDVVVLGGARGMTGAAVLAATAAVHAGAGRVWWHTLQAAQAMSATANIAADIMVRDAHDESARAGAHATVVCGCGGGEAITPWLAPLLASQASLVLDADALNAIAAHPALQQALRDRRARGLWSTVITPHPLEAARLLAVGAAEVQSDRLNAAQRLAEGFGCCVVLKGSGTVIAAPGQVPVVNPTGNARLAIAGTGDVLAGLIGARLARAGMAAPSDGPTAAADAHAAVQSTVCAAVWEHGIAAERADAETTLTASELARRLQAGG